MEKLDPMASFRLRRNTGWLTLAFGVSAALLIAAQASRPNFSGRWELDKSRSDFGSLPPDDSAMELIEHQEPKLTITQVWRNAEGEHTVIWQLTTDGAENLNRMNETEIASRTVWEGSNLVTDWRMKRGTRLSEGKYNRSLSEDRKTLTVGVRQRSGSSEVEQHLVFVEGVRSN
jgi:hypothetical protein